MLIGSAAVSDLVAASKSGDWTNFALTETVGEEQVATPANAFWFAQSSSRNNPLYAALQQEGLFLLGGLGEATIPAGPFTAAQIDVRENSWYGTERGIPPLIVSGLACFIQSGGADIRGIQWTEAQRKYEATSLRELTGDVFTRAIDMAGREGTGELAATVYIVDEDGSLATLEIRQTDPRIAWTVWDTGAAERPYRDGRNLKLDVEITDRVLAVTVSGERTLFLVERGGEVRLEELGERGDERPLLDLERVLLREPGTYSSADGPQDDEEFWVRGRTDDRGRRPWTRVEDGWRPDPWELVFYSGGTPEQNGWKWRDENDNFEPTSFQHATDLLIGRPYRMVLETVPFAKPSQSGTRLSVLKSRIFGLVVIYLGAKPQEVEVNLNNVGGGREARADEASDVATPVAYGSTSGWKRRTTVRLDVKYHCHLAALTYRASG